MDVTKSAQKAGWAGADVLKNDIICLQRCCAKEEAGLQERLAMWLGGWWGPPVTGGAQSTSADREGLPCLFLTPAQFREDTH